MGQSKADQQILQMLSMFSMLSMLTFCQILLSNRLLSIHRSIWFYVKGFPNSRKEWGEKIRNFTGMEFFYLVKGT